jgi:hypothetical protein
MMDEADEGLPRLTNEELANPYTRISYQGFEIQLWQVAHIYGVDHDMPDAEWRAGASSSDFRAFCLRQNDRDSIFSDFHAGAAIDNVTEKRPLPDSPTLPSSILANREHVYPRAHGNNDHGLDTQGLFRLIDELVDEVWSDETDEEETEHATAATGVAPLSTPYPRPLYSDNSFPPPPNPPPNRPLPPLPQQPRRDKPSGNRRGPDSTLPLLPSTPLLSRTTEPLKYSQPDCDSESSSQRTITPRTSRRQFAAKPAPRVQDVPTPAPSQPLVALPRTQETLASEPQLLTIRTALQEGPVPAASGQHLATRSKGVHDAPVQARPGQKPVAGLRMREVPRRTTSRQQLVAAPQVQEDPMRKGYGQPLAATGPQETTVRPPSRQRLVATTKEVQGALMAAAPAQQPTATPRVRDVLMRKRSEQQLLPTPKELQEEPFPASEGQLVTIRRVLREGPAPPTSVPQPMTTQVAREMAMRKGFGQQLLITSQERKMTPSERQLVTMSRMLREGPVPAESSHIVPTPRARDATMPAMSRQQLVPTPQVGEARKPTLFGQQPLPRVRDTPMHKASEQQLAHKASQQQLVNPPRAQEITMPATARPQQPQVAPTQQMRQVTMPAASGQQPVFTLPREVSMPTAGRTGPAAIPRGHGEVPMPTSRTVIERPPISLRTERSAPASVLGGYGEQMPMPMPATRRPTERPPIPQATGRAAPTSILRNHGEDSYRAHFGDSYGRRRQDSGSTESRPRLPPSLLQQPLPEFLRNPPSFLQYPPDFSQQPPESQQPARGAATGAYPQLNKSKSSANVSSAVTRPVTPTAEDGTVLTSRWSPDSSPESTMQKVKKVLSFANLRPRKSKVFRKETGNEANEATAQPGQRTSASSGSGRSSSGKTGK